MANALPGGYMGKMLRVDLTTGKMSDVSFDEATLRKWVGGAGIGAKILYEEVPPGVEWSDPENRLIVASGPVGGTTAGTGTFSVVTKGPMINGALSSQANGMMGAFMKFSGFDGIIVQGASKKPVYLYLHDGVAELRDARRLVGKDTWETQDLINEELGKKESQLSVMSIGPAGEHLVRFATIGGDRGHVVAHGGPGAVMGAKKLKAIVAEKGKARISIRHKDTLTELARMSLDEANKAPLQIPKWGTGASLQILESRGALPVKNYTLQSFPDSYKFAASHYRERLEIKRKPCWGCRFDHCGIVKVKEGPYAGYVGEEPEYEGFAAWGSNVMQTDLGGVVVLSNEVDRYGIDTNEAGWIMAWLMDCYEKGLLTKKDLDGIEMTWGNVEAMRAMLRKIANRDGFGDLLAEGLMRAATKIGGKANELAVYTMKGNIPRGHDHRVMWHMMLDVSQSNTSTDEASLSFVVPAAIGLPADTDSFTPEGAAAILAAGGGLMPLEDSMPICKLTMVGVPEARRVEILNAVTGWDFTPEEGRELGRRTINLFRAFNVRHGHTPEMERPSVKYASAPTEGPAKGKSFLPVFDQALRRYYELMGWDRETGKPLPATLKKFGLGHVVKDLWP
ncbi:MAG: aldehyde ferredoxin oxidoreductase C-terminal domain-containing protein [Dehalococcoidia bacterium]|nr:aldehyde ferredoxin oxidoreductase C-terminal domain-containing protein [Dehalococcoidia bacterium]